MAVPAGHPNGLVKPPKRPYCEASQADLPANWSCDGIRAERLDMDAVIESQRLISWCMTVAPCAHWGPTHSSSKSRRTMEA